MQLTFLNAAFLFAAFAALLPLIIHLISRRKVETVDFSSLRFLRELERKKIRRVRIRQILLLVIRSLIILAAAIALARPTLSGPISPGAGHARTSVAIVVDDSASMSRDDGYGGSLFSSAVALAGRIAGLMDEGDQAFLVTASDAPRDVIPGGTFSRDALIEALGDLTVTSRATHYAGAVELALELLGEARNLNRELYLIGDVQRSGWNAEEGVSPDRGGASSGGSGMPVRAYVLPLPGPTGNIGVAAVRVSRKYGGTPGLFSISADVTNKSRRSGEFPLRLFIDGVQVGQAGVDLEPGASGTAAFATAVDEELWHYGWVELPADGLEVDNRRYFVIRPTERSEVLVVRADDDGDRDDAYYLERALDPMGSADRFRPVVIPSSTLANQEQGRFPVVILADVGRLEAGGERWIGRHLSRGGGLLTVLGNRTDVRHWNGGSLPGSALFPLREPFDKARGVRLAPAGPGHPLLEGLVFGERLIDEVSVTRGFAAERGAGDEILEFPGIGPALLVAGVDGGEIGVLLTGIDPAWSELPRSGFLVPLVHRLVERLSGSDGPGGSTTVGHDLFVAIDATAPEGLEATLPDGASAIPELSTTGPAGALLPSVGAPGIYRFTVGERTAALGVANVDPAESDLTAAAHAEIAERLAPLTCRFVDADTDIGDQILESRRGRELWRVFVYLALALLALEMFLARPRMA